MSKRDNTILLEDIVVALESIFEYTYNISFIEFENEKMRRDAVYRNFEIIGEAANRLTIEFVENHTTVNWHKVIGLRNRIIHAYFDIDDDIIWNIIQNDLPILKQKIIEILKQKIDTKGE